MNQRTMYLISLPVGLALFLGGILLGNVLRDDESAPVIETVAIAAATPADPDSGPDGPTERFWPQPSGRQIPLDLVDIREASSADPGTSDPDGSGTDGNEAAASGVSLNDAARPVIFGGLPNPAIDPDGASDPDGSGDPDSPADDEAGEIYLPPTRPGGLAEDGSGEPDPDAPVEVRDGVIELDPDDPDPFGFDTPAPSSDLDPLPFRDPCADVDDADAEAAEELCPDGTGGTIVLLGGGDGPPDPLDILRQFYGHVIGPVEVRCPAGPGFATDGVYRPNLFSNNPADFTIRYWRTADPSTEQTVTYRTRDSELEWWIDRRLSGEPIAANPYMGVHNCLELPLPERFPRDSHFTFEIHGVDDFGSEDTVRIYQTFSGVVGRRPPASFSPSLLGNTGRLAVPYDATAEMVYMAVIPRNGPRASERSCTEVEGDILDGRHRSDAALGEIRVGVLARTAADTYDEAYDSVAVAVLQGEEGTRYQLCVWAAEPPTRSFDRARVVYRNSFLVRAPRALRVRVSVGGGHADQPLEARSVRVSPTNWPNTWGASFPAEDLRATAFMLDGPVELFDSGSNWVPRETLIEVRGPTGSTTLLDIETPTRCFAFSGFFSSCPERGTKQYDVQIPGRVVGRGLCGSSFGTCDPPREQTYVGNVRLLVERYSGPAGPPTGGDADGWQVFPHGSFAAAGAAERPETPQIDSLSSYLRATPPGPMGRPGLTTRIDFDRPVRVEATPWANFEQDCVEPDTRTTETFVRSVSFTWNELCYRGTYSLSLLAVDEAGNELDIRTSIDGELTGHPGWSYVQLPGFDIAQFQVEITILRLGDGIRPQRVEASLGGTSLGPLIAPGHPPRCVTDAVPHSTFRQMVANDGGRPISWGDALTFRLDVSGTGDGRACGLGDLHASGVIMRHLWLDDLLAGPMRLTYDGPDAEIVVEISEVTPAR